MIERVIEIHLRRLVPRGGTSLGVAHGDAAFEEAFAHCVGGDVHMVAGAGEWPALFVEAFGIVDLVVGQALALHGYVAVSGRGTGKADARGSAVGRSLRQWSSAI
ncbi:hypothetical protein GCM10027200_03060 [Lentzea nigeriaca]